MKRSLGLLCMLLFPIAAVAQQWNGDSTATGSIHRLGNVGIGLTNPGVALDVLGSIRTTNGINTYISRPYQSELITAYPIGLSNTGSESENGWDWPYDMSTVFTIRHPSSHARSAQMLLTYNDRFLFRKPNADGTWRNWVQVLTANAAGRVGIGTHTPSVKLEVAGLGRFTGSYAFSIGGDANHPRIQYDTPNTAFGFLNAGNGYAGLKAKSLAIGSYGDTVPPLNGAIISGNVGIGTDTPNDALEVAGNIRFANTSSHLQYYGDANHYARIQLYESATGHLKLMNYWSGGNADIILTPDQNVIVSQGKLGIGTSAPQANLDIEAGQATLRIAGTTGVQSYRARLLLDRGDDYRGAGIWVTASTGTEADWYAGVPYTGNGFTIGHDALQPQYRDHSKLFIATGGQVGLGTTSPMDRLSVYQAAGSSYMAGLGLTNANWAGGNQIAINFRHGDGTGDGVGNGGQAQVKSYLPGGGDVDLHFVTTQATQLNADPTMVVTGAGNVGIGTTNPGAKLAVKESGAEFTVMGDVHGNTYLTSTGEFRLRPSGSTINKIMLSANDSYFIGGNVGIGTTSPQSKLSVDGTITSKEVVVTLDQTAWPDYVFEEDYALRSLSEVEQFVEANGHLPEVPSATEVSESGVAVGDMQATLLKKIEELTLYLLEQQELLEEQQRINEEQRKLNQEHKSQIEAVRRTNATLRQRIRALQE